MPPPDCPPTHPTATQPTTWRLLGLTLLVLLAHWAVLRAAPLAMAAHPHREPAGAAAAFSTRTIVPPDAQALPQPVAVNPARVAPKRSGSSTGRQRAPDASLFTPPNSEENPAPAPADIPQAATKTVANLAPPETQADDAPTLLAAATTTSRPLPAKTVRNYVYPPSARLKYAVTSEVKGFPLNAHGELSWVHDGKTYDARMRISHFLAGSRVQTSTGQLTAQGLEPTRFGDKVRSEVAAHFEREKGKISFSANTPDAPLLTGAQDQLSIFMQLASMLAGDPGGFPKGSTLSFQAVGPRSADTWVFSVGATERLTLPGGELTAVHLWRDPAGEYDPKTDIWLAPELGYLPVRIRLTQRNGDFADQQWESTQK